MRNNVEQYCWSNSNEFHSADCVCVCPLAFSTWHRIFFLLTSIWSSGEKMKPNEGSTFVRPQWRSLCTSPSIFSLYHCIPNLCQQGHIQLNSMVHISRPWLPHANIRYNMHVLSAATSNFLLFFNFPYFAGVLLYALGIAPHILFITHSYIQVQRLLRYFRWKHIVYIRLFHFITMLFIPFRSIIAQFSDFVLIEYQSFNVYYSENKYRSHMTTIRYKVFISNGIVIMFNGKETI